MLSIVSDNKNEALEIFVLSRGYMLVAKQKISVEFPVSLSSLVGNQLFPAISTVFIGDFGKPSNPNIIIHLCIGLLCP